ncbi:hypothetical protein BGY98DRAFT_991590 [Russula aff. rugulosa BPL654]|nr:hypothetical protein BGY98DRAFT_991590 [Russula aff. rugulosa BPL654]
MAHAQVARSHHSSVVSQGAVICVVPPSIFSDTKSNEATHQCLQCPGSNLKTVRSRWWQ